MRYTEVTDVKGTKHQVPFTWRAHGRAHDALTAKLHAVIVAELGSDWADDATDDYEKQAIIETSLLSLLGHYASVTAIQEGHRRDDAAMRRNMLLLQEVLHMVMGRAGISPTDLAAMQVEARADGQVRSVAWSVTDAAEADQSPAH